jgi:ERCC4-type nuclease
MLELKIDCRENKIKNYFENKYHDSDTIKFSIKSLDLGDFIFELDGEIILIIERKTINDLNSSIRDGRHKEQKIRLLSNYPYNKIMYLIEGTFNELYSLNTANENILYGAILNTQFRDKIQLYRTYSIDETIKYLLYLYKKINKSPDFFTCSESKEPDTKNTQIVPYESIIKLKKKDNMTPTICQILQLAQIPGISVNISKVILTKYGSLKTLILEFGDNENFLAEVEIETSTGKKRRLGKVISSKIYQYLIN